MPVLNREQIMAVELNTLRVDVPEWGKDAQVIISEMSGTAREEYERLIFDKHGKLVSDKSLRACLVACTAVDEQGALVFTRDDVEGLGRKQAFVLYRLYEAAMQINGMGDKVFKGTAKNS